MSNLIVNGSFENAVGAEWTIQPSSLRTNVTSQSGSYSLQVYINGSNPGTIDCSQTITTEVNSYYLLSYYFKSSPNQYIETPITPVFTGYLNVRQQSYAGSSLLVYDNTIRLLQGTYGLTDVDDKYTSYYDYGRTKYTVLSKEYAYTLYYWPIISVYPRINGINVETPGLILNVSNETNWIQKSVVIKITSSKTLLDFLFVADRDYNSTSLGPYIDNISFTKITNFPDINSKLENIIYSYDKLLLRNIINSHRLIPTSNSLVSNAYSFFNNKDYYASSDSINYLKNYYPIYFNYQISNNKKKIINTLTGNSWITIPMIGSNYNMEFGTGNFTIEFFFNPYPYNKNIIPSNPYFFSIGSYPKALLSLAFDSSSNNIIYRSGGTITTNSTNLFTSSFGGIGTTIGKWEHIAISRNNGTVKFYGNGVYYGSIVDNTNFTTNSGYSTFIIYNQEDKTASFGGFLNFFTVIKDVTISYDYSEPILLLDNSKLSYYKQLYNTNLMLMLFNNGARIFNDGIIPESDIIISGTPFVGGVSPIYNMYSSITSYIRTNFSFIQNPIYLDQDGIYFNIQNGNSTGEAKNTITGNSWIEMNMSVTNRYDMWFGTQDFTIEFFIFIDNNSNPPYPRLFSIGTYPTPSLALDYETNTNKLSLSYGGVSGQTNATRVLITQFNLKNVKTHISITRKSGTIYVHLNGILKYTGVNNTDYNSGSGNSKFTINNETTKYAGIGGYINGFTVIRGFGLHDNTNFIPSNIPPPNIPKPSTIFGNGLLLYLTTINGQLVNYGSVPISFMVLSEPIYLITTSGGNYGGVAPLYSITSKNNLFNEINYTTFNGIYLNIQDNNINIDATNTITGNSWLDISMVGTGYDMWFGTGDFTIEFFIFMENNSNPPFPRIFSIGNYPNPSLAIEYINSDGGIWLSYGGIVNPFTNATRVFMCTTNLKNCWTHLSINKKSGTIYFHLNGILKYSGIDNTDYNSSSGNTIFTINNETIKYAGIGGYMHGFTIIKGTSLHNSSNFIINTYMPNVIDMNNLLVYLFSKNNILKNGGIIPISSIITSGGTSGVAPSYLNNFIP